MKTLIVYVHLIAACVAVGILLIQDLALAKTRGNTLSAHAVSELKRAATIISLALIVLWISGLTLVLIGYLDNPQEYLMNQKLWAKFTVVGILTLNGIALHHFSFPRVASSRGILGLGNIEKTLVVFTDRCSAHVNRNVDELGDFEYGFSLANWKKHFIMTMIKLNH